jgi:hypothetical protein
VYEPVNVRLLRIFGIHPRKNGFKKEL